MDTTSLFTSALQLPDPWSVSGVEFRDGVDGKREPHITIGFHMGSRFHCPEAGCGETSCPVHDTMERTWRHPERQDPREGLQEHGLFQHDDLPDLRQTRPQHRHHLTRFTHAKQRKA